MKKMKTGIGVMLALLCCILMCTGVVYATGDDTDGTELQVAQPVILEVQLGPQWAGVEFQLKTDVGLYPGTIAVGQDGILRTELGNSGSYVLSCLTLNAAVPAPGDIPSPDVTQQETGTGAAGNRQYRERGCRFAECARAGFGPPYRRRDSRDAHYPVRRRAPSCGRFAGRHALYSEPAPIRTLAV